MKSRFLLCALLGASLLLGVTNAQAADNYTNPAGKTPPGLEKQGKVPHGQAKKMRDDRYGSDRRHERDRDYRKNLDHRNDYDRDYKKDRDHRNDRDRNYKKGDHRKDGIRLQNRDRQHRGNKRYSDN